jgi:hypothetical protein
LLQELSNEHEEPSDMVHGGDGNRQIEKKITVKLGGMKD